MLGLTADPGRFEAQVTADPGLAPLLRGHQGQGEHSARRLRALDALSRARDVFSDPHFLAGDEDETTAWIVTTNGGAGRVTSGPDGWVLDDGFGRHLYTFPGSTPSLEA
ncbi:hypothetical protein F8S09_17365 [Deinococcus sp. SDU3-2]|uniref:Uncharacterized protein n=1 Tax=Deinococcus terrestris TaxID=2651870 RepID=A0A7X1NZ19_9DEIO|nr:hypothetical protein [Deinococcus terrestris]MPY68422.1 hypothetical protein [Deinococcus terrestris]